MALDEMPLFELVQELQLLDSLHLCLVQVGVVDLEHVLDGDLLVPHGEEALSLGVQSGVLEYAHQGTPSFLFYRWGTVPRSYAPSSGRRGLSG